MNYKFQIIEFSSNLDFYLPLEGAGSQIYATLLYQMGGRFYTDNYTACDFSTEVAKKAFEQWCSYFSDYSFELAANFSNRFRSGEMPIGISAYTSCNQLSVFASELSGLWTFVPLPGHVREGADGKEYVDNTAMATVTGCVMIDNDKNAKSEAEKSIRVRKDACAWEFMRWYTGSEFQADYANEIVSILGIAARPATANKTALESLPWTAEELNSIRAQFENLAAVPNQPGSYYLARYVNFAFLDAYNEGKDASDALLEYVKVINDELTRRREEFGMLTYDSYLELKQKYEK